MYHRYEDHVATSQAVSILAICYSPKRRRSCRTTSDLIVAEQLTAVVAECVDQAPAVGQRVVAVAERLQDPLERLVLVHGACRVGQVERLFDTDELPHAGRVVVGHDGLALVLVQTGGGPHRSHLRLKIKLVGVVVQEAFEQIRETIAVT